MKTPGVGDGQGSLAYCSLRSHKESDTTEWLKWTESYSTLKSTVVSRTAGIQALASREQTRSVTDWRRRGDGSWWSWGIVSHRRRRAGCPFTHTCHWWPGSWLLDGFNSIFRLDKVTQWCLGSSSFNLVIEDTLALDCILPKPPCSVLHSGLVPQRLTVPAQIKKTPFRFLHRGSLQLLPLLLFPLVSLTFLWASKSIRSSLVSSTFPSLKVCSLKVCM